MKRRLFTSAALLSAAIFVCSGANAEMLSMGKDDLSAGKTIDVPVGGPERAYNIDSGCRGFITEAPTLVVANKDGGTLILSVSVNDTSEDPTMVVQKPDGTYLCNDDDGEGNRPSLKIEDAAAGDYKVWAGIMEKSNSHRAQWETAPGQIMVSSQDSF